MTFACWMFEVIESVFSKEVAELFPLSEDSAQKIKIERGLQGTRCEVQGTRKRQCGEIRR